MDDIAKNLIAALIYLVAGTFLVHVVYPYIAMVLDRNVDLAGTWLGQVSLSSAQYTYRVDLKRRVRQWTGKASITRHAQDKSGYDRQFKVAASRRGDYVIVSLLGDGADAASMATGLLVLEDSGRTMRGAWAYRPTSGTGVATETIAFKRQ